MKIIKRLWHNIPRKTRISINILMILLLLTAGYFLLGCPAFTPEQQFRRLEQANLMGPSEIIDTIDLTNGEYDHIIVADDGDAAIVYGYNDDDFRWTWGKLHYREKTGDITVFPAPNQSHTSFRQQVIDLPILVFHDYPTADRAELDLTLGEPLGIQQTQWEQGEEVTIGYFEKTYHLEAQRETAGYFRFNIHAELDGEFVTRNGIEIWEETGKESLALQVFSQMIALNRNYIYEYVPATVRLYDRENNLIVEEHLTIRSVAGERYARETE